jgi:hypothetical protein
MAHRDVDIHLQLSVEGDEVSGRASTPDGGGRAFAGWIGLFAALDALAAQDGGNPGATGGQGERGSLGEHSDRKEP